MIPSLEPGLAKDKGNKAFQAGKYDKAIKYWQGGLKNILSTLCSGPEAMHDTNLSELDLTLNLNIAMAHMKKGDFDDADRAVDKALARREALPPHLITKALYRKASAQKSMRRLDECLGTLKDLLSVEEGHAAAKQMYQEVDREWTRQKREQKKNMSKMFSKMQAEDKKEDERGKEARQERRRNSGIAWSDQDVDAGAFERGESPPCDGKDWGMSITRTVLWAMEEFCAEDHAFMGPDMEHASIWFLGASSTCELRLLRPKTLMTHLPGVKLLEISLIGFLGELDPDNKRVPDPKADALPEASQSRAEHVSVDDRFVSMRVVKGTLQEALDKVFQKGATPPAEADPDAAAEDAPSGEAPAKPTQESEAPAEEPAADGPTGEAVEAAAEQAAPAAPETPAGEDTSSRAAPPGPDAEETAEPEESPPETGASQLDVPMVPPSLCVVAHPHLHRYFTEFSPAVRWLIENNVPTVIIGSSEPDPSWKQDEVLLRALGARIVVGKRESPYPMCLPDNPDVRKCNHIIGFQGGKSVPKERLTKIKLELLSQDYSVR